MIIELPAGLIPCLSSSVFSALKASISVSKAESQLAVPLTITTFLDSSVASWPKGSAVCTGAGVAAAAGGGAAGLGEALAAGEDDVAGDIEGLGEALAAGVATGAALAAGEGEADGAGDGLADAAGAGLGVWASVADRPNDKAAAGISAAKARRRNLNIFILPNSLSAKALHPRSLNPAACPGSRELRRSNTRAPNSSHDRCVMAASWLSAANHWPRGPRIAI